MHVEYDDVFKPTTVVQRGKKDQSKFLVSCFLNSGANLRGGANLLFWAIFSQNCMKMKKIEGIINIISPGGLLFEQKTSNLKQLLSLTEKIS